MKKEKTTGTLTSILQGTSAKNLDSFFEENTSSLIWEERPFAAYMRAKIKEKNRTQQKVFLEAEISEGYGYKLIAEEKRTKQRDTVLRICIAAGFSLNETQHALKLYGMPELYVKIPRDAVLMTALNAGMTDVDQVDDLLMKYRCDKLVPCRYGE